MEVLTSILNFFDTVLWSSPLIYISIFVGLLYTVGLKGFQVRYLKQMVNSVFEKSADSESSTSFEAFALTVAARVGTGNIVGVATAIAAGGPGAVFWMWVMAILGAATSFAENTLAQVYKEKVDGMYRGGTSFFVKKGLGLGWFGTVFAFCSLLNCGILHTTQPNSIADAMYNAFGVPHWIVGVIMVIIAAIIISGGLKSIIRFTSKIVPIMCLLYLGVTLIVLGVNITKIPAVFALIFKSAFGKDAIFGGMVGSAIAYGIKRGVYSSEAGMGTTPQAAAIAGVSHPAKVGLTQALSVYVDTLLVCTATALMILLAGTYNVTDAAGGVLYEGISGVNAGVGFTQGALDSVIHGFGYPMIAVMLALFSFTTLVGCFNISESDLIYMFKGYSKSKTAQILFKIWFLIPIFIGCISSTEFAWLCADIGTGASCWVTLIAVIFLFPIVRKVWNDYEKQVWEEAKASNTVSVHFLGISESVFDKLEWRGEKCSWDTFKSGNYVLVDYGNKYAERPVSYYQTGGIFQMDYKNGNQKDYEVIGEALMPYALDYPYADCIYITVLVPEEEYITQTGNESAMYAAIDAKKGEDKQIKEYIDKNILKENDMINVFSVLDMKESFQRYVSKYYMIGSFLVVILAFIGIMNFFNTTATSVISRKKELALLEVVGMTKKQISKMLVAEGFLYLGGAFMIAVLLVVVGAKQILINTLGTAFFFRLHLTIVPCVLMIPILVGIAYVIPKYQFEKMSRESVVERIRKE